MIQEHLDKNMIADAVKGARDEGVLKLRDGAAAVLDLAFDRGVKTQILSAGLKDVGGGAGTARRGAFAMRGLCVGMGLNTLRRRSGFRARAGHRGRAALPPPAVAQGWQRHHHQQRHGVAPQVQAPPAAPNARASDGPAAAEELWPRRVRGRSPRPRRRRDASADVPRLRRGAASREGPRRYLVSIPGPLIHMYNKSQRSAPGAGPLGTALVVGDSLGDATMADGAPAGPTACVKVGLLNAKEPTAEAIAKYAAAFDVVILDSKDPTLAIVREICDAVVGDASAMDTG